MMHQRTTETVTATIAPVLSERTALPRVVGMPTRGGNSATSGHTVDTTNAWSEWSLKFRLSVMESDADLFRALEIAAKIGRGEHAGREKEREWIGQRRNCSMAKHVFIPSKHHKHVVENVKGAPKARHTVDVMIPMLSKYGRMPLRKG